MAGVRKVLWNNFANIFQSCPTNATLGICRALPRHHIRVQLSQPIACRCKSTSPSVTSHVSQSTGASLNSSSSSGSTNHFSTSPSPLYVDNTEDDISTEVLERVGTQVQAGDIGRLFAVVHVGGHQKKVTTEDIIVLTKPVAADVGERIRLNKVMLVGSSDFSLVGRPVLSPDVVRVEATVIEKTLSHTKVWFVYRRRKNWRKMKLLQDQHTFLRINSIELLKLNEQ